MAHGRPGRHIVDVRHQLAAVKRLMIVGIRRKHIAGLHGAGSIARLGADGI
ncbi:hypothetical protein D3C75_1242890 [compost metagenome]